MYRELDSQVMGEAEAPKQWRWNKAGGVVTKVCAIDLKEESRGALPGERGSFTSEAAAVRHTA